MELLLPGPRPRPAPLAAWLDGQNAARRAQEQRILDDIAARCPEGAFADRRAIVLCGEDWHLGVIGIVAARLVERYHRPALLFGLHNGLITGSCRSIPGIDLHACLSAFSGRFERFGGHAFAAGVTMRPEAFDAFAADFDAYLREHFDAETFRAGRLVRGGRFAFGADGGRGGRAAGARPLWRGQSGTGFSA